MHVLLLHNPDAGAADHTGEELIAALTAKGLLVSYCSTQDDDFPDCLDKEVELLLVAGGDGTVAKVMTGLPDRSRPVGIIPLDGSNNAAISLGFDREEMLAGGWPESCRTRLFHIARLGGLGEEKSLLEGIGFGAFAASLDLDPPLAPQAAGLDGQFSVVLLEEDRRLDMLEWLNQPDSADPPVRVVEGRRLTLELGRKIPLRVDDGLTRHKGKKITFEIEDEPLHLLVPNGSGQGEVDGRRD